MLLSAEESMNLFDFIFRLLGWEHVVKVLTALVSVFSALLTPIIGAIAVYIAYQQHVTNRRQLRLALFDKRLKVFNSTAKLIARALQSGRLPEDELLTFLSETRESNFLFGADIEEYITEVYGRAVDVHAAALGNDPQRWKERMLWFSGQMEEARKKFGKYMAFPGPS
jgi:hypothetical protein